MSKLLNIILRLSIGIMAIFLTYKMGNILFNATTGNFKQINISKIEISNPNHGSIYMLDITASKGHYVKSFTNGNSLASIVNTILSNPLSVDWAKSLPLAISVNQINTSNQIEIETNKNTIEKLRVNGKLIMGLKEEDTVNFAKLLGVFFLTGSLFLLITWILWVISLIKHLNKHHTIQNYPLNNTVADAINGWKYILSGFKNSK